MADRAAAAELRRVAADLERTQHRAYADFASTMIGSMAQAMIEIVTRSPDLIGDTSVTTPPEDSEDGAASSEDAIRRLMEVCDRFGAENLDGLVEQIGGRHSPEGLAVLAAFESFFGAALVRAHLSSLMDAEELNVITGPSRSIRLAAESDDAITVDERSLESSVHTTPEDRDPDEDDEPDSAALWAEAVERGLPGLIMSHGRVLSALIAAHPAAFLQPTSLKLLG